MTKYQRTTPFYIDFFAVNFEVIILINDKCKKFPQILIWFSYSSWSVTQKNERKVVEDLTNCHVCMHCQLLIQLCLWDALKRKPRKWVEMKMQMRECLSASKYYRVTHFLYQIIISILKFLTSPRYTVFVKSQHS